ncbi:class I SAM-dependent RNA methyltransferase [Mucilaginibacter rubeus]|uniref:Class I SAM-dependent RNA methyltransferase n=1 Tax=Mucilaginibacter rubeus TaxID=2027860 RepID=A0AAE6MLJ6_9SPHI|nr:MULTISPECIES: class I SAM-dependent RNA methyltransferase [Mucilaginibacter]QEM07579.1 class I SAM-dependent RNA methyltransferase [Mucilaginibacter rubeus]QEM20033.1 class I SAM-dependent RNA methyltransferase [Mucilaginibacter gossypii]QTE43256.1 class I SAM-dependent RNA methyltransferase [Mucilaginibacter rubeus]QTE49856.1 class I SAM-dependent RNA methyltransferase [Mucilaginibacter rubeus]QTE54948.1 class I SAM-dependent RNA methyltransferase [Mucilaginibacter rubeus]
MQVFHTESKIIITCNKRLSPYLQREVEALGYEPVRVFPTGVELKGTVTDTIPLNLNLRCASQVLYSLKTFTARDPKELYDELVTIEWEKLIDFTGYFSVSSNVNNEHILTPLFANVKVKDAIADRIKSIKGIRPDSGPEVNKTLVHLYWQDDRAEIFLDTSGETLAKHSYRKIPGKAPMLEALAASTIMATKWDMKSTFINPMCGSGTLAIEAALLATDKSPGLFRMNYAFMHILGYDETVFFAERRNLKDKAKKETGFKIIATDISEDAVDIARKNARTAGVEHLIDFAVCDFEDTEVPAETGVVMFNPEYGERLGVHTKLEITYKRMGDFMKKKCLGYNGYVFTGNPDLAKKIGLKAARKIEFYNGKLDCRLFEYELYQGSKREPKEEN